MDFVPGSRTGTETYPEWEDFTERSIMPNAGYQNHSDIKFELPVPETPISYFLGVRGTVPAALLNRTVFRFGSVLIRVVIGSFP